MLERQEAYDFSVTEAQHRNVMLLVEVSEKDKLLLEMKDLNVQLDLTLKESKIELEALRQEYLQKVANTKAQSARILFLEGQIEEYKTDATRLQKVTGNLETEREELQHQLNQGRLTLESQSHIVSSLREEVTQLRSELAGSCQTRKHLEQERDKLLHDLDQAQSTCFNAQEDPANERLYATVSDKLTVQKVMLKDHSKGHYSKDSLQVRVELERAREKFYFRQRQLELKVIELEDQLALLASPSEQ